MSAMKSMIRISLVALATFCSGAQAVADAETDSLYSASFAESPSEVRNPLDIAGDAYAEAIAALTKDADAAKGIWDAVKEKINNEIQKGKDWIENGGIRDEIKKQVEKAVAGKVSDEDKQRILNMTDALCNVGKDGGKSLVDSLGTDGKDLAASLAVNEIKKQIASALPKDMADNVNAMVDAMAASGSLTDPAVKQKMLEAVQSAVSKYVPYENSAKSINDLLQQVADGKGLDVVEAAKDLGKSIGIDALKDVVSKNLDPKAAAEVNALIDGYVKDGVNGLTDAALAEINAAIDKYAPGADSAAALKDVLQGMKDGTITADKIKDAVKAVGVDGAKALIDKSNLSEDAKKAAKEAVDALAKDGWSGLTDTAKNYIQQYVSDKLGEDAGKAIGEILDAITTPGGDVWEAIDKNGPIIGEALFNKVAEKFESWAQKQIDKLIDKHPFLKELFNVLGIDGKNIVEGIKNFLGVLKEKGLSGLFDALSQQALKWFKDAAAKLIDWGVEKLCELANHVIGEILEWVSKLVGKAADVANWGALKDALNKLQAQLDAARTNGTIRIKVVGVGQKVVDWFESRTKKGGGTEKAKGSFK